MLGVNGQVAVPAGGQLKVPTPRVDQGFVLGGFSFSSALAHSVGISAGDHDAGVVEQPAQEADGGDVLGQQRPQDSTGDAE